MFRLATVGTTVISPTRVPNRIHARGFVEHAALGTQQRVTIKDDVTMKDGSEPMFNQLGHHKSRELGSGPLCLIGIINDDLYDQTVRLSLDQVP